MAVGTRPGVYVQETQIQRLTARTTPTQTYGAFIGTALKGPNHPILVESWSDFVNKFGGFHRDQTQSSLAYALWQYFQNADKYAYVARALGTGAGLGTVTTSDARLTFNAVNPGDWSDAISVAINLQSDTAGAETFEVVVREDVNGIAQVKERFPDLSMNRNSPRYVERIVNSTTIGSLRVTVVDVDTDDSPLAAGQTPLYLTGGGNGSAPNDYASVFDKFDDIDAMLIVNTCGDNTDAATIAQAVEARGDSFLIVDPNENETVSNVITQAPTLSDYTAIYYPWIYISDPSPDAVSGSLVKVPPGASMAGVILSMEKSGRGRAPAGVNAKISGALQPEARLTSADLDTLSANNINPIRSISGSGVVTMGARTRGDVSSATRYISVRRTMNYVKKQAQQASRFALFHPNTPALWDQLRVANAVWLNELHTRGALAGRNAAESYYVKCDSSINTPQTIANGEIHMEIGVAPVYPSEFIIIRVGQFESGITVTSEEA